MSLLSPNRNRAHRHLTDDAFADLWSTAAASGEPVADPHLASCAQCRARYAAFTGWLDRIHDDAVGEADEALPAERLAAQQAQVMRRLEALERPARVIAFPRFARPVTSTPGHAQRWVAAAAAAGLIIGLAAGQLVDVRRMFTPARTAPTQNARLTTTQPVGAHHRSCRRRCRRCPTKRCSSAATRRAPPDGSRCCRPMDDITPRARDLERPR